MKPAVAMFLVMVVASAVATAGEIYGNITEAGHFIQAGVTVTITIQGRPPYTTLTDKFGSYRIFVREQGPGTLVVDYQKQAPALQIYSYDKAYRYNLVLERAANGNYSVRAR